ncbi:MAG: DUF1127 domain-containing protein [Rhodospirillaceae bacterium]|nr:DUF1127 domain-containing protein [Rhodospirillaceae bacterium]
MSSRAVRVSLGHSWWRARLKTWAGVVHGQLTAALAAVERARQRHALQSLDDRMLKDIGLTRADVEREVRKPFWRP